MSFIMTNEELNQAKEQNKVYDFEEIKRVQINALIDNYSSNDASDDISEWLSDNVEGIDFHFDKDRYEKLIGEDNDSSDVDLVDSCLEFKSENRNKYINSKYLASVTDLQNDLDSKIASCVWLDENGTFSLISNHTSDNA